MENSHLLEAQWAWLPECRAGEVQYAVFRRRCRCSENTPFELAMSADSRYKLYLDGNLLGCGPCRGDLLHYCYESYTGTLAPGEHVFAVEVLSFRNGFRHEEGVWSEIHHDCGGFWTAGHCGDESLATPGVWRGTRDLSRRLRLWSEAWNRSQEIPAPPMEAVDFTNSPGDWKNPAFNDGAFQKLRSIGDTCLRGVTAVDPGSPWYLTERSIPQLDRTPAAVAAILEAATLRAELNAGTVRIDAPAGTHLLLLDLGRYRTTLIHLTGRCRTGVVRIAYAEKLSGSADGGRRDPFPGGRIGGSGYADFCKFASNRHETFDTFWYRAGRYVELLLNLDEPGVFEFSAEDFHYPFVCRTSFRQHGIPELEKLFEISWNTARCCAHEHYEDCPYYEQLQYVGDTRIQALISYAVTGDGRLGRQALLQFHCTITAEGLSLSRYPCNVPQYIPLFSLYWILMVDDYHAYFGDLELLRHLWNGIGIILDYFESHRDTATGLIGPLPFWTFADWTEHWPDGRCDRGLGMPDALTSLIYAEACRVAEKLGTELEIGATELERFRARRTATLEAVHRCCFDPETECFTDLPGKPFFSEQINIWALLAGAVPDGSAAAEKLLRKLTAPNNWSKCSLFFSFYFLELLRRKGAMTEFELLLNRWRRLLQFGFTTFPEGPNELDVRSDCHAWSASIAYEIVRTYFGVTPLSAGFETVEIAPQPGGMRELTGSVPLGNHGILEMTWKCDDSGVMIMELRSDCTVNARVKLPGATPVQTELAAGRKYQFSHRRISCGNHS